MSNDKRGGPRLLPGQRIEGSKGIPLRISSYDAKDRPRPMINGTDGKREGRELPDPADDGGYAQRMPKV